VGTAISLQPGGRRGSRFELVFELFQAGEMTA